jgi:hypothetical protein
VGHITVELTGVVEETVLRGEMTLGVQLQSPIGELLARSDEAPVVVDGVLVVGGQQKLAIEPVDPRE